MARIDQVIGEISTLADAPTPQIELSEEEWDTMSYNYTLSQKQVNTEMQARIVELNTAFEQANELAVEVNDAKDITVEAKNTAVLAKDITVEAKDITLLAKEEALQAAIEAKAARDYFDDRYLGAKAVPPTTDNDGDPLKVGAVYWDTSVPDHNLRSYNGTAWQDYGIGVIAGVASVNGKSGDVTLNTTDIVGLEQFKNELEAYVRGNVASYATGLKFN